jgi:hypothetical protein
MRKPWYFYAIAAVLFGSLSWALRTSGPWLVAVWLVCAAVVLRRTAKDRSLGDRLREPRIPTGQLTVQLRLRRAAAYFLAAMAWAVIIAELQKGRVIPDNTFVGALWLGVTIVLAILSSWHGAMALMRFSQNER